MEHGSEKPERFTAPRLAALVEGTTAKWWRATGADYLMQRGILKRVGKSWFGKRSAVLAAFNGGSSAREVGA